MHQTILIMEFAPEYIDICAPNDNSRSRQKPRDSTCLLNLEELSKKIHQVIKGKIKEYNKHK